MLEAILNLLTVLGVVAQKNAGNNERLQAVGEILGVARDFIESGSLTVTKLQQLTNTVRAMVEEDRNPTAEEFAALRSRSDAAHDRIQGADLSEPATLPLSEGGAAPAATGDSAGADDANETGPAKPDDSG